MRKQREHHQKMWGCVRVFPQYFLDWVIAVRSALAVLIKALACFSVSPSNFWFSSFWMYASNVLASSFVRGMQLSHILIVNILRQNSNTSTPNITFPDDVENNCSTVNQQTVNKKRNPQPKNC